MARKQVENELAVVELAKAYKALDDACPDVGMGPFWPSFVDQALHTLGLTKDDVDRDVYHQRHAESRR